MNHYQNAEETYSGAKTLFEAENFRLSVNLSCLAIELFLKSKLDLVDHDLRLETSHDVIGIYKSLITRFTDSQKLAKKIDFVRKYYNDSRYPAAGIEAYTEKFAGEFLSCVEDIKMFVDKDCAANVDDLYKKFTGGHV